MNWSPEAYKKLADLARPTDREPIGELALDEALITVEQLEECLREQAAMSEKDRLRLGEILVRRGYLRPVDVTRLLERQVDEAGLRERGWRYEIRGLLGRGATALVYRAWDRELRREVALKVIRREHVENAEVVARTLHEARAAAHLSHPNLVAVHDVGEKGDLIYVVMELVEGRTLAECLRDPTPLSERLRQLAEVADAVEHAHQQGVVHRDLKPRNILIDPKGRPHVMDFGLARMAGAETIETRAGTIIGTPLYMAPEQVRGESSRVGPRSDVYALGAILYEILTGRTPHSGDSPATVYNAILTRDPAPPRFLNPSTPRDLEIISLKALEKEPWARYASAGAMAEDLRLYLAGRPIHARPTSWAYRGSKFLRRYPWQIALLGSSTALMIGSLIVSAVLIKTRPELPDGAKIHEVDRLAPLWLEIAALKSDWRSGRTPASLGRERFRKMLREFPRQPAPRELYVRAHIYLLLDSPSLARRDAEEALKQNPDFGPARMIVAESYVQQFRQRLIDEGPDNFSPSPEAREAVRQAMKSGFSGCELPETSMDRVLSTLTRARHEAWANQDWERAREILKAELQTYGAEEYLLELGDSNSPARALEIAPTYVPALLAMARAGMNSKEAESVLTRAIEAAPWDPVVRADRGIVRLRWKDYAGALSDLERAIELDASLQESLNSRLELARQRGR